MKTKKILFMVSLLILGGISKGNAQINNDTTVFNEVQPDAAVQGLGNVLMGSGAGVSIPTTTRAAAAANNNANNSQNVFVGINAGLNSTASGIGSLNNGNTFLGYSAGLNNTTGSDNVFIGRFAGFANTTGEKNVMIKTFRQFLTGQAELRATGSHNTMIGFETGDFLTSGEQNCFFGSGSGQFTTSGLGNTFLGRSSGNNNVLGSNNISIGSVGPAGSDATTQFNILIGSNSGQNCSGNNNVIIGRSSGSTLTTGINNSFLGRVNAVAPGLNNTVILATGADWDSNRLYIDESGRAGFNLGITGTNISNTPQNRLEIVATPNTAGLVTGTAGLRFRGFTNTTAPTTANPLKKVLSVNGDGDVILVDDAGAGTPPPDPNLDWHVTGNELTSPSHLNGWPPSVVTGTSFIGTLDEKDIIFRRSKIKSGFISLYNTAFGLSAMLNYVPNGQNGYNTALGVNALSGLIYNAQKPGESADNVAIGYNSLANNTSGIHNTAIGWHSGRCNTGGSNVFIGSGAGEFTTGTGNVFIGNFVGQGSFIPPGPAVLSNESNKLYIDNFSTPNPLIYGDFSSNNLKFNGDVEINSNTSTNSSGLKFTNLNNASTPLYTNISGAVLTVDSSGKVVLTKDQVGTGSTGITNSCTNKGFIPNVADSNGNLDCSQIYDAGVGVGIGTGAQLSSYFNYTYALGDDAIGNVPLSGTARLRVNGVTWSGGFYATSDKKFKKNIESIENPLETIQKLDGKTYLWNKEANKEMDFDNGLHSGFIAQDLEKVLPHLVITNEKGDKAVNYTELIPYLVEAIKEQQTQINDLKTQISENFKAQNQDLIQLNNTKIISVSPNPSKDIISVALNVEKGIDNALLQVYDLNGKLLNSLNVKERGENISKTFQKDNFGTGVYIVSLVVNGKSIDSKKIIFE